MSFLPNGPEISSPLMERVSVIGVYHASVRSIPPSPDRTVIGLL